jgi:hypothetical protein
MSNYPASIREIASKVERLGFRQVTSWQSVAQMIGYDQEHLEHTMRNKAATAFAHEFTKLLLKHTRFIREETPEGIVVRADAIALRYDELIELLYRAYAEGQSDGMKRSIRVEVGQ